jgi:hypothetical protein
MKKCSTFLAKKEMQIKTMVRFHLLLEWLQSRTQVGKVGKNVGKRNPHMLLEEIKLIQPLWKTVRRLLKILKAELPYNVEIPLLRIYSRMQGSSQQRHLHNHVY